MAHKAIKRPARGTRRPASKRSAVEQTAVKSADAERTHAKRTGANRNAAKRAATKRTAPKRTTENRTSANRTTKNQTAKNQTAKNRVTEKRTAAGPVLLSGGNPQIAKADGDAPVQAYIAAMPGWKRDLGRRLDAIITRSVPGVKKAVKWNSPFYGVEDQGWFLGIHCFTKYVKVAFFRGALLRPLPPGASKTKDTRYLDIHADEPLDEVQFASWVRQAASLPGWLP